MKVWNMRNRNYPKDAVYVGRPTKWGNPFEIGGNLTFEDPNTHEVTIKETNLSRERVIELYKEYILDPTIRGETTLDLNELKGKDLLCWCAPKPCHADLLIEAANPELKKSYEQKSLF